MSDEAPFLAVDACVYRLASGDRATWSTTTSSGLKVGAGPSLTLIGGIEGDLTINYEKTKAPLKIKNRKHQATKGTLRVLGWGCNLIWDPIQADFAAIFTAFLTDTPIAIALLDRPKAVAMATGWWADWEVVKFARGEPIEGVEMANVEFEPAYTAVEPEVVQVPGS